MTNPKWDIKTNYMLACSVCKYGLSPERWDLVADDLAGYLKITPQTCKIQFDFLCEQYGQDWQRQTVEPLHIHVFSSIKRQYYGDLCDRMTESRDLLMVMYDFIRLFRGGHITLNDINTILQDIKNSVPNGNNTDDNDRQQKIKMLERLRFHIAKQMPKTVNIQYSSLPVELLPPSPFLQQQQQQQAKITNDIPPEHSLINDRQVPSMNVPSKSNATGTSSYPVIIQSNTSHLNNPSLSNGEDIDEIELSSDDENDRTATAQPSNIDEPMTSSNLIDNQDDSTFMSDEQIETNESSNILPITTEISNSNDRDLYEHTSSTSVSDQSTSDTQQTSSISGHPVPSNLQLNASISGSSDYVTLDSDRLQSGQNHSSIENESNVTTPRQIPVVDDEVARMDAEQIPESIPADITDIPVPNDNAVFVIDELVSSTITPQIPTAITNLNEHSDISENGESTTSRSSRKQSHSTSTNYRKSVNSILTNLRNAKYGPDFAKSLQNFKLPDEYYIRVKKPLDIPEIRERMHNGDYDDNILLFERDVLLMITNALSMYHRDLDIHGRAQYMMNFAMELFSPLEEVFTPWKMNLNDHNGESSSVFPNDHENDSTDTTLNPSSSTRTPSVASTSSSSVRIHSSRKTLRTQTTSHSSMSKRQRKTTN